MTPIANNHPSGLGVCVTAEALTREEHWKQEQDCWARNSGTPGGLEGAEWLYVG